MSENQATYPIAILCRPLGVSCSGNYAWAKCRVQGPMETQAMKQSERSLSKDPMIPSGGLEWA